MVTFKIDKIKLKSGSEITTVAKFNDGYSHIAIDDGCWVVVNGGNGEAQLSPWIFLEAIKALKGLPSRPGDYYPLMPYYQESSIAT